MSIYPRTSHSKWTVTFLAAGQEQDPNVEGTAAIPKAQLAPLRQSMSMIDSKHWQAPSGSPGIFQDSSLDIPCIIGCSYLTKYNYRLLSSSMGGKSSFLL